MVGRTDKKDVPTELTVEAQTSPSPPFLTTPWFHIALLTLVVGATFGRTLSNYFLADDFCQIAYVRRIFDGDPGLFWSNFTGNYMQITGMNVYRPWLMCSLVNDWLLYHAKAWGYYLTNLIYFAAVVSLFYLVVRQLTSEWSRMRSSAAAVLAALFFAVSPLHAESISWVVGRVDIIAACFYLLSFSCFLSHLKKRSKRLMIMGVIAFILAIGSKEMAVGLPVLVVTVAFLWGDSQAFQSAHAASDSSPGSKLWPRVRDALLFSLPLWLTLGAYFVIRFICLKTLVGGYVAGFGASQLAQMVHHWLDPDTIRRLWLPLNGDLYDSNPFYGFLITCCYAVVATIACVRILAGCASWRWVIFLFVWCAVSIAPIFQLWGLGYNLEGARFYFFLTMPMSLIIPILLFHPAGSSELESRPIDGRKNWSHLDLQKALYLTGVSASLALLVLLQKAAWQTNMLWVHAGKEVKRLSAACQALVVEHPGQTKFVILGIPTDLSGAHMILNGTTFDTVMRPPFSKENYDQRLLNCSAILYSPGQYVNGSQLRWLLTRPDVSGPYVWSRGKQALLKFEYGQRTNATTRQGADKPASVIRLDADGGSVRWQTASHATSSGGPVFSLNKTNPLNYQILQFDIQINSPYPLSGRVTWSGTGQSTTSADQSSPTSSAADIASAPYTLPGTAKPDKFETVTVNLGHYWRWYAEGDVRDLQIDLPAASSCVIRNVRLLPASLMSPSLSIKSPQGASDTPFSASMAAAPIVLHLNATTAPYDVDSPTAHCDVDSPTAYYNVDKRTAAGADHDRIGVGAIQSIALEIGRRDYFFDNFDAAEVSAVAETKVYPIGSQNISLDPKANPYIFSGPGFYQLRVRYLNRAGKSIGLPSDPVTVHVSR